MVVVVVLFVVVCLFVDVAGCSLLFEVVVSYCVLLVDGLCSVLSLSVLLHADVVVAWCFVM